MNELPSASMMLSLPGRQGNAVDPMYHLALAVLDLDIDQVAHVVRVIDVRRGHVIRSAVRSRLAEGARIVMPFGCATGLTGSNLVDVDGNFLYAFSAGLFHQRGRPGNVRIGASLDLCRGFQAVAVGTHQRWQADQRGSSHAP